MANNSTKQTTSPETGAQKPPKNEGNKKPFTTKLTRINDALMPMIERQLVSNNIDMNDYQRQCVLMGIAGMNATLDREGLTWSSDKFDDRNVSEMLQTIAMLQLNAAAVPREIYFQTRNVKVKNPDGNAWKKQLEMGIEGDGNDAILRRFGAGVKVVGKPWLVREGDDFKYPSHKGLDTTPPEWVEKGKGRIIRVVYPILKEDGTVDFQISERDDVMKNLAAHINNNLMNETFGIAKNRFEATDEQQKEISEKKKELLDMLDGLTVDQALDVPELQPYISPAWKDRHSRESMIIRKMRNNAVKPIPKDFSSAFVASAYLRATDDIPAAIEAEIGGSANSEPIDVEYEDIHTDPDTGEVLDDEQDDSQADEMETPEQDGADPEAGPETGEDGQGTIPGAAPASSSKKNGSKAEKPKPF